MELKLLLIEDSPDDAELLIFELESNGFELEWYRVEDEPSLHEAIKKDQWDLVISDYKLHGFSGREALKIVRSYNQYLPFILISGAIGEEVAVNIMKEGAQDYILKHNMTRLSSSVERVLKDAEVRIQAEKDARELERANERLSAIYNGSTDFMLLLKFINGEVYIESVNKAFYDGFEKYIGKDFRKSFEGMNLKDFMIHAVKLPESLIETILSQYDYIISHDKPIKFTQQFEFGDKVYMEIHLIPLGKSAGNIRILSVTRDVTERVLSSTRIKKAYEEVARLKEELEQENTYLQQEIEISSNFEHIIYKSRPFQKILKEAEQVSSVDSTVLLTGETGTGKELVARAIHNLSRRSKKPLVKLNCAALPDELIESELFGHEKGAFTGADKKKIGRFELAHHGTIFLDEIGDMPIRLQTKLLRVIQEKELERLGGTETIPVDVRVISATNRDLERAIAQGQFREDLFYRLNVFPIHIPPLRERKDDIIPITQYFINKYSMTLHKPVKGLKANDIDLLKSYHWPGNVRELENLVERAVILAIDGKLSFRQLLTIAPTNRKHKKTSYLLREVEKEHILKILELCQWKINGRGGAAEILGLKPSTLRDRMKKLEIYRPSSSFSYNMP